MMVSTAAEASGTQTTESTTSGSDSLGKDEFLSLLLAQLKYQDPLSPMENSDFTAQMAQFSSLEQLFNVNNNLEGLQQIGLSANNTQALTLIGKVVEVAGNSIEVADGSAQDISFSLAQDAEDVSVYITNSAGEVVKTIEVGAASSGSNRVSLDASDLPDGTYTYVVDAVDDGGNEVAAQTYISGTVDSISMEDGVIYIHIGDMRVTMNEITMVSLSDEQSAQTD